MQNPSNSNQMLSKKGKIGQNSFFILASRILEIGAGLAIIFLVANNFGVKGFGEFSFIRAVAFVLFPLMVFGSRRIIIREISVAKERTREFLSTGIALNIFMTAILLLLAAFLIPIYNFKSNATIMSLYLAIFAQSFLAIKATINAGFMAHEIAHFGLLGNIINRILVIISLILVILLRQDLLVLFAAIAFANFVSLGITFLILKCSRIMTAGKSNLLENLGFLLKESYPIAIVAFMVQGYTYVNTFFLRFFQDDWNIAMFESTQRIIIPLSILSTSILLGLVPTLSRLGRDVKYHEQLLKIYAVLLKLFFLIAFPICAMIAVTSEPIILLIYNDEFLPASKCLKILIWSIVPLFANGLLNFVLTSMNKQRLLVISNIVCFLVTVSLSWILVKDFGYIGVSFSVLVSSTILFVVNFYFVSKFLGRVRWISMTIVPGLLSFIFYCLCEIYIETTLIRIFCIAIFIIVYFLTVLAVRLITMNELVNIFRKDADNRSPKTLEYLKPDKSMLEVL